ncbi:MAG TPA: amino acid permease [Chthoniobacterales bacterium]|jgi:amino acid transporter/nucleotide-binding universal stress UspA family protein|nr:amino acid permease [Chthoniobacterales bacterium]
MATILDPTAVHRPRNVDWKRAAALLYGDWGTSKAYVIGLAFVAAGFASGPIILAVCLLTAVVAYNYIIVCAHFPDGGGVYSAARQQSRFLASTGALLLVANFIVTAALSGWAAVSYFGVPSKYAPVATMVLVLVVGAINYFGPKHSGSVSIWLAIPAVIVVVTIVVLSAPHLNIEHFEPRHENLGQTWVAFVGVILALSGVEAVANITGVMKLDPDSTPEHPKVTRTATKAILPVAIEVVLGTLLLGWAMLSLPKNMVPQLAAHKEDMLRFLAQVYGGMAGGLAVGQAFSIIVAIVFGLLLLSAVNTAVVALIGVVYMMAQDGEMPRRLAKLNSHGVPSIPLVAAVAIPILVLAVTKDFEALAGLYAIGVVGAIAVNLGSCTFNKRLGLPWYQRAIMGGTFVVLAAVWLTIAKTKSDALFFAMCVLGAGYALRAYSHKVSGLKTMTVAKQVAEMVTPDLAATLEARLSEGQKIMVAARGVTPALAFALEEAHLRKATLCVLYVKEIAVFFTGAPVQGKRARWQEDPAANAIMSLTMRLGQERGIAVQPVYAVSEDAAATILDLSATLGVDYLIIGASQRTAMAKLLGGSVVTSVAQQLPESIRLVIYG